MAMVHAFTTEALVASLRGKRAALFTNPTGLVSDPPGWTHIAEFFRRHDIRLGCLLCPEHGIDGTAHHGVRIADGINEELGVPQYYMHAPDLDYDTIFEDIDVVVYCIQEAGSLFYTYKLVLDRLLPHLARRKIAAVVVDRPNPLNGVTVEGHLNGFLSVDLPVRHGMTDGELARMIADRHRLDLDLTVLSFPGWRRDLWFDQCGLPWIPPSTALPEPESALLYVGTGLFQQTAVSVGRGTYTPFKVLGAPFIAADAFQDHMNGRGLPGVAFTTAAFTPAFDLYAGNVCRGIRWHVTDRDALRPFTAALHAYDYLITHYPGPFALNTLSARLPMGLGNEPIDHVLAACDEQAEDFRERRTEFLIY